MSVTALWERDILLEHPAGSGIFERAKPVGFVFGNTADLVHDVSAWFAPGAFMLVAKLTGPEPDGTRVFTYRAKETLWQVRYRIIEDRTNVGGLRDIPLAEDPVYTVRKHWGSPD